MNIIFKWDGSELKGFTEEFILEKIHTKEYEYWVLEFRGERTIALIRKTKCYTPCLVDELKPIFGLTKLGTHYSKSGALYIIFIRARSDLQNRNILTDYTLNHIDISTLDSVTDQIKRTYIFRDLLCLTKSCDSSLAIRKTSQGDLYVVSLIDSAIKLKRMADLTKSTYLPEVVFNRWFKDHESPSKVLTRMCKIYNAKILIARIFKLRCEIETITERVSEGKFAGLPDMLIARINSKIRLIC